MDCQPVAAELIRERHLGHRLAGPGPDPPQGAERRTELDPDIRLGAVEGRYVHRRHARPERFQVHLRRGVRCQGRGPGGDLRFRMQCPALVVLPPAEDLHAAGRLLGCVEKHLHPVRGRGAGPIRRVPFREQQRVVQLHLLDDGRSAALGLGRRRGHGTVERARRQQPAEHPVVGQPRRVVRQQLGVERHLTACRLVPRAQQRVPGARAAAARRGDPVAFALERIPRQRDAAALLSREQPFEPNREPCLVGAGDRRRERALHLFGRRVARGTPQAGQHGRRWCRPRQSRHRPQYRVRADLHERFHAELGQGLHRPAELHLFARVAAPVGGVRHRARLQQTAAQVAHQGDRRGRERDPLQRSFQVRQRRLHQRAVVGGAVAQQSHPHLLRLEPLQDRRDIRSRTAERLVRAVVHGHAQPHSGGRRVVLFHRRRDPLGGREHHRHRSRLGQRPDQGAARRREAQPVLQAEHASGLRRRDLAQAVPDHHVRADPQARPQRRQRALQCVDRRLLPGRLIQTAGSARASEHHVQQGGATLGVQQRIASVQHRAHHRLALVEPLSHSRPLAGLPGEGEGHPRLRLRRRTRFCAGVRLGYREQARAQRLRVPEHHAGAVGEVAAPDPCRPRQIGQRRVGCGTGAVQFRAVLVEPSQVSARHVVQRCRRLARQRQEPARTGSAPAARQRNVCDLRGQRHCDRSPGTGGPMRLPDAGADAVGGRISLQHHVRVGAGPAEAAHPGQRWMLGVCRPLHCLRGDPQRQPLPVHLRARVAKVQVRGNDPLPHRQHDLHHADDAGRRFQVADVGLHRADQQRPVGRAPATVGGSGGVGLDRVAHLRAGAMRLHVVHVRRLDTGALQRGFDHPLLRGAAGHGQARARAVLVQRRGADHRPDPIAGRLRIGQPLQHQNAAALTPDIAVGRGVERLAAAVRRQHAGVGAQLQQPPGQNDVHSAGQRQVRLTTQQPRRRLVQRHQR